jgi:hypothetical protein
MHCAIRSHSTTPRRFLKNPAEFAESNSEMLGPVVGSGKIFLKFYPLVRIVHLVSNIEEIATICGVFWETLTHPVIFVPDCTVHVKKTEGTRCHV